jgi:hypothetical protein
MLKSWPVAEEIKSYIKKMRSNYALVAWYSYVPALFVARNIFEIVIKIPVNANH